MEYTVQWVPGVRQWPSHGTTHTGQYPPGKGYSYLRTWVLVLTATLPPGTPPTHSPSTVPVDSLIPREYKGRWYWYGGTMGVTVYDHIPSVPYPWVGTPVTGTCTPGTGTTTP